MSQLSNGHEAVNGWRTDPMYTFSDAARLARVSPGTIRNWLFGYTAGERSVPPLFRPDAEQGAMVSFVQLVEIVVASRFRKAERKKIETVRRAYENARKIYKLDYPFAHLRLSAIGGHIVHDLRGHSPSESLQALDVPEQRTLPGLVQEIHDQLDWDQDLASRWYPVGKNIPIAVDPLVSAGMPTILGRGVTVRTIYRRWKDGHLSMDFIADDYQIERSQVEFACRYAEQIAA